MKILFFIQNGLMKPEYLQTQFDYAGKGDKLMFCNGSLMKGFQDSCDMILMACENPYIDAWAVSEGITIKQYNKEPEAAKTVMEVEASEDDLEIDKLISSQVAKAEIEVEETEEIKSTENIVPALSDIPVGWYIDPDGKTYERKRGPKLKGDLKAAIEKFGFEALKLKDSDIEAI